MLIDTQMPVEQIDVADKVSDKTIARALVDFFRRTHLQHAAMIHHGNARSHGHRLFLIVCHHHHRHADRLDDIDQLELRALAQFLVQRAQRFIKQQQLRFLGQTACQRHTLLLPTGKLMRLALGIGRKLHQIEHLFNAGIDLRDRHAFALQTEGDVIPHVEVRKQRIRLKHHVDRPLIRRQRGNIDTIEQNTARSWRLEAGQHAQQGRLAAARTSQQRKNLTFLDRNRNIGNGQNVVKTLDQLVGEQKARFVGVRRRHYG